MVIWRGSTTLSEEVLVTNHYARMGGKCTVKLSKDQVF